MFGRITCTFEFSDIWVRWNLDRDLPLYKPRFNIAAEQISPTIRVIPGLPPTKDHQLRRFYDIVTR